MPNEIDLHIHEYCTDWATLYLHHHRGGHPLDPEYDTEKHTKWTIWADWAAELAKTYGWWTKHDDWETDGREGPKGPKDAGDKGQSDKSSSDKSSSDSDSDSKSKSGGGKCKCDCDGDKSDSDKSSSDKSSSDKSSSDKSSSDSAHKAKSAPDDCDCDCDDGPSLCKSTDPPSSRCDQYLMAIDARPVDLIFTIDQSGSMGGEIAQVRQYMNGLSTFLGEQDVDYRVILLANRKDDEKDHEVCIPQPLAGPNCADSDRFKQIDVHVGSTDSIAQIMHHMGTINAHTRHNSLRQFVFITDDKSDTNANKFRDFLEDHAGYEDAIFHAIVGQNSSGCAKRRGEHYIDLANKSDGLVFDICATDWEPLFAELAADVSDVNRRYKLTAQAQALTVSVTFDGQSVEDGKRWFWESGINEVVLQDPVPAKGTAIEICYVEEAEMVPCPVDNEPPPEPEVVPTEYCDGIDNNCDGDIDEGFGVGEPCQRIQDQCVAEGIIVCHPKGHVSVCSATMPIVSDEVCDGIDNNCNGLVDEGTDQVCDTGCGEAIRRCVNGHMEECVVVEKKDEICDGIDNNCNGIIDEGFDVGDPCEFEEDWCHFNGTKQCTPGGEGTMCARLVGHDGTPIEGEEEVCDGIDNNCNGLTDEGVYICPDPLKACFMGSCVYD